MRTSRLGALACTLADVCMCFAGQPAPTSGGKTASKKGKKLHISEFQSLVGKKSTSSRWADDDIDDSNRTMRRSFCISALHRPSPPSAAGLTLFLCHSGWAGTAAHCAWRGAFLLRCRPVSILGAASPAALAPALQGLHQQRPIPGRCRGNCPHFPPRVAGAPELHAAAYALSVKAGCGVCDCAYASQVVDVRVLRHHDTGNVKGCFVEFETREDLERALHKNGTVRPEMVSRRLAPFVLHSSLNLHGCTRGSFAPPFAVCFAKLPASSTLAPGTVPCRPVCLCYKAPSLSAHPPLLT